jgi:hypothetical protein
VIGKSSRAFQRFRSALNLVDLQLLKLIAIAKSQKHDGEMKLLPQVMKVRAVHELLNIPILLQK